ncbi:MAG: Radical domain protein [Deltaproteobacteria bacterium]|jgi:putative pyruvate formate lyase activating enzyme|nr:Radical domain protein [Deltaproteobacteria bacterium]
MEPNRKDRFRPAYLDLHEKGALVERGAEAQSRLECCRLCPRECKINRQAGEKGFCRTGLKAMVSSHSPHFGEEDPLVGTGGSGTIFFTHCNLLCLFCQNFEISHLGEGREAEPAQLARMMLHLQDLGCHNINFVSPSHVVAQILAALPLAVEGGLKIPLVYNTGGYDSLETLRLLEGVFDIYMPDLKFMDGEIAHRYCRARDYPEKVRAAIREMHRQGGDLTLDQRSVARRGLLVRHLVLPGGLAGTREAMRFLAREVSPHTYVNLMDQYRPCGEAGNHPPLNRRITGKEYEEALNIAREEGIHRLDQRKGSRMLRFI